MSTKLRTLFALSTLASLGLLAPTHAMAGIPLFTTAFVTIDDAGLTSGNPDNMLASLGAFGFITPTASGATGPGVTSGVFTITNESPSILGSVDLSFDYHDNGTTLLGPGAAFTVNYNISGLNEPLSDTLSIVFRGLVPGDVNTHVEVHFKSDNDVLPLSLLAGGAPITETGAYQDLSARILQDLATGSPARLQGFHLQFASDAQPVPLPSAVWSGLALLGGLGAVRLVRRRPKSSISHP